MGSLFWLERKLEQKPKDHLLVVNFSGRGNKDIFKVADHFEQAERQAT